MKIKKESGCDNCGKKANRYYNIEDDKFCLECAEKWTKEKLHFYRELLLIEEERKV